MTAIKVEIICWRDIPVQVRVRRGRERATRPLADRFQKTVYRAAFRGKAITGDPYQEAWHAREWQDYEVQGADLEQIAAALAAELETAYNDERLNALALNKGYDGEST